MLLLQRNATANHEPILQIFANFVNSFFTLFLQDALLFALVLSMQCDILSI